MLRVKGIEVFYGDLQALRGVSLEVNQGEIVSIVGSNGAGKSTTLMTISGVLKPKRGEIQLDQDFIHQHSLFKNCFPWDCPDSGRSPALSHPHRD